jgi:hypothetical protein
MRIIVFCFLLLFNVCLVQAGTQGVSLDLSEQDSNPPLKVYQNAPVKVNNTFNTNLYDLTVTKPPLSKEIISVAEFRSGQSFDLHFPKVGTYELCFSREKNATQTCLTLNVLKRITA